MATLSVASKIISYLQVKENTIVSPAKTQVSLSKYLVATLSVASTIISYLQVKENTIVFCLSLPSFMHFPAKKVKSYACSEKNHLIILSFKSGPLRIENNFKVH